MAETFLRINPADRGQLVKMLIVLEPRGIYVDQIAYLFILYIVQPLVCKTVTRLLGEIKT